MTAVIYAISDPCSGSIRYIGRTVNFKRRMWEHRAGRGSARCGNWFRSLVAQGISPQFSVLEEVVDKDTLKEREQWWIAEGRRQGWDLTNLTDGGDGTVNPSSYHRARIAETNHNRVFTPQTRAKIGAASKGRHHSPETIERCREAAKRPRKPLTEEHKAKLRQAREGKPLTEEHKHRISESLTGIRKGIPGKPLSDEAKAKLSAFFKGRPKPPRPPMSPEHRAKIGAATRGKKRSPEHKAKIAESLKRFYATRKEQQE